ncbi:MAG: hypothetical protein E7233_09885, partial [Lachnospiraceae bacterium]|nr:hypothetical protein [Lachnospiraceae bacterium]
MSLIPQHVLADDFISDTPVIEETTAAPEVNETAGDVTAFTDDAESTEEIPDLEEATEAEVPVTSEEITVAETSAAEENAAASETTPSVPVESESTETETESKAQEEPASEQTTQSETVTPETKDLSGTANTLSKNVRTFDNFTYKITVSYDASAGIPADAELSAKEITAATIGINEDDIKDYIDQSAEALKLSLEELSSVRLFDISLIGADGTEYQPNEKVAVKIELLGKDNETEDMRIVHFGSEPEELSAEVDNNVVSFETDAFSTFSLVDVTVLQRVVNAVLGKSDSTLYENDDIILTGKMPILGSVEATPVTVQIGESDVLVAYDIKIYANPIFKALGITWQPTDGAIQVTVKSDALAGKTDALQIYHMAEVNSDA